MKTAFTVTFSPAWWEKNYYSQPGTRVPTDTVAGRPCTEWQTGDVTGAPTLACITDDGVLLRASAAGRVLVEALHLSYATPDPAVFRIPEDYRKIAPPAVQRPAP